MLVESYVALGMALPLAVEKCDQALGLREPLTVEQQAVRAMPTAEQNSQALAELSKAMRGLNR